MPEVGFTNLLVVALVALAAPLLLGFAPRVRVSVVAYPALALGLLRNARPGPTDTLVGAPVSTIGQP